MVINLDDRRSKGLDAPVFWQDIGDCRFMFTTCGFDWDLIGSGDFNERGSVDDLFSKIDSDETIFVGMEGLGLGDRVNDLEGHLQGSACRLGSLDGRMDEADPFLAQDFIELNQLCHHRCRDAALVDLRGNQELIQVGGIDRATCYQAKQNFLIALKTNDLFIINDGYLCHNVFSAKIFCRLQSEPV
jgi:hypothetical protein